MELLSKNLWWDEWMRRNPWVSLVLSHLTNSAYKEQRTYPNGRQRKDVVLSVACVPVCTRTLADNGNTVPGWLAAIAALLSFSVTAAHNSLPTLIGRSRFCRYFLNIFQKPSCRNLHLSYIPEFSVRISLDYFLCYFIWQYERRVTQEVDCVISEAF